MTRELPRNIHFSDGRYYFVRTTKGKAKWTPLAKTLDESIDMAARIKIGLPKPNAAPSNFTTMLRRRWTSARWRSAQYGIAFDLEFDELCAMAEAAAWSCALTGIPFSLARVGHRKSMPFSPSIDRIESSKGYVGGNVRIVCLAVNYALNEWGDAIFRHLAEAYSARKRPRA